MAHGPRAVWALSVATLAMSVWLTARVAGLDAFLDSGSLQWWALAPAFAAAEAAVVHLKFRKDAHSFR